MPTARKSRKVVALPNSAERRAARRAAQPKDPRQPFKLPAQGATSASIRQLVEQAIQQALSSQAVALLLSGYVEGRGLDGNWGIRVKDLALGDLYLVPQRVEELPDDSAPKAGVAQPEAEPPDATAAD